VTVSYEDPWLKVLTGDCRDMMATLPPKSVHCIVTSPPYFGLRDYGLPPSVWGGYDVHEHSWGDTLPDAHVSGTHVGGSLGADKPDGGRAKKVGSGAGKFCACGAWLGQLGLEPTPELYVEHLVEVFRAAHRVLRDDGTLWLNLGDSYAGGKQGRDDNSPEARARMDEHGHGGGVKLQATGNTGKARSAPSGYKAKDLIGVPWMAAFALRAAGWYLRTDIVWAKSNPMPESVEDRPTRSHEFLFLLTKQPVYFYDHTAIKEGAQVWTGRAGSFAPAGTVADHVIPGQVAAQHRADRADAVPKRWPGIGPQHAAARNRGEVYEDMEATGTRNKRDVWTVATQAYPEAHYAVWPPALIEPCIKAGTSAKGVCPECGAPWVRVVERRANPAGITGGRHREVGRPEGLADRSGRDYEAEHTAGLSTTTGWQPSCAHLLPLGEVVVDRAVVLDPFGGSGTTGLVAQALGRKAILIDLSGDYLPMQLRRASREFGVGGKALVDDGTSMPPPGSIWEEF
jgi:DNA modification methylase